MKPIFPKKQRSIADIKSKEAVLHGNEEKQSDHNHRRNKEADAGSFHSRHPRWLCNLRRREEVEKTSARVGRVVAAKQKELTRRGSDNAEKHSTNGVGKQLPKMGC